MIENVLVGLQNWLLPKLSRIIRPLLNLVPAMHILGNCVILLAAALIGLFVLTALEQIMISQNRVFSLQSLKIFTPRDDGGQFTLTDDLLLQSVYLRDKDFAEEDKTDRQQPLAELTYENDSGWHFNGYSNLLLRYVKSTKNEDDGDEKMRLNTHRVLVYAPTDDEAQNSAENVVEQISSVGFSHAGVDVELKIGIQKLNDNKWQVSVSDLQLAGTKEPLQVMWPFERGAAHIPSEDGKGRGKINAASKLVCVTKETNWKQDFEHWAKQIAANDEKVGEDRIIATLGGPVPCIREQTRYQIGVAALPGRSIAIVENSGFVFLVAANTSNLSAKRMFSGGVFSNGSNTLSRPISQQRWPVTHDVLDRKLQRILLGQTTFRITEEKASSSEERSYLELKPEQFYVNALAQHYDYWLKQLPSDIAVSIENPDACSTETELQGKRGFVSRTAELNIACNAQNMNTNYFLFIGIIVSGLFLYICWAGCYRIYSSRLLNPSYFLFLVSSIITVTVFVSENYSSYFAKLTDLGVPNLDLIDKIYLTGFSWCITTVVLAYKLPRKTSAAMLWFATSFLMFSGQVVLAELAFGANKELQLDYYTRNIVPLGFFNTGILLSIIVNISTLNNLFNRTITGELPGSYNFYSGHSSVAQLWSKLKEWVVWPLRVFWHAFGNLLTGAMLVMVIFMILVWVGFGNEEGISRIIQPSEFVKFSSFYFVSLAFAFAARRNLLRNLGPNLVLLAIIVAIYSFQIALPVLNSDFSPVLIMVMTAVFLAPLFASWFIIVSIVKYMVQWARDQNDITLPQEVFGLMKIDTHFRADANKFNLGKAISKSVTGLRRVIYLSFDKFFWWPVFVVVILFYAGYHMETDRWPKGEGRNNMIVFADETRGCGPEHSPFQTEWLNGLCNTKFFSRVASALDMSFSRLESGSSVRSELPDEGAQVRLSRASIGVAPCLPPQLPGAAEFEVPFVPQGLVTIASNLGAFLFEKASLIACSESEESGDLISQYENSDTCHNHLNQPISNKQFVRAPDFGCPTPVSLNSIPVIQSDFVGAFIVGRFGLLFTTAIILAQFLVLFIGIWIGLSLFRSGFINRTSHSRRQLLSFLCFGGAIMLGLQWIISWSNVFGALPVALMAMPVMGQPMSFIAYASSHIVLMIMPIYMIFYIAIRLDVSEPDMRWIDEPPDITPTSLFRRLIPKVS